MPKVLWVGDAGVSSGFAMCSHAVCDHLHASGWDVHVLGINYWGEPHDYPYKIYPSRNPHEGGRDAWGVDRLPFLIADLRPDIVVILQDPWNIPGYMQGIKAVLPPDFRLPPIVGWLAVDSNNQNADHLTGLSHVIVWTKFAARELIGAGYTGKLAIVPLGVDTEIFKPMNQRSCRDLIFAPDTPKDSFVVGVVGRNQPRKRLDIVLESFALWTKSYGIEDAYLFLHIGPTGDVGYDIYSLGKYYGITDKLKVSNPAIGKGFAQDLMPKIYNSFDVYLSCAHAEGWNLPALEAMACGIPCVLPDQGGPSTWAKGTAHLVPCDRTVVSAPIDGMAFTLGAQPNPQCTVEAINEAYVAKVGAQIYTERVVSRLISALDLARTLSWSSCASQMQSELESVLP